MGASAWGRKGGSDTSGGEGSVRGSRKNMVTFGAAGGDGRIPGSSSSYNDPRLSRAQPWRSRYPTPHDLKDRIAHNYAASTDHGA